MRRNGKLNIGCLFYIVVFAAAIIVALFAVIAGAINNVNSNKYQKAMDGTIGRSGSQITGSLMVAYDSEDHRYSTAYIPEELIAEKADEVRYVVFFETGEQLVGTYSNGAGAGYQRKVTLRIHDLKTGEDIAEETFLGSMPPTSITKSQNEKAKKVYGSSPDSEKIQAWILNAIG